MTQSISIHRATVNDAAEISAIWEAIVAEQVYSAVARAFTPEEERTYIESLLPREAIFVARSPSQVVGFQSIDRWVRYTSSMDHVGQMGTFVRRQGRGRGIGRQLAERTLAFARQNGYEKLIIFVRAKNLGAQSYYKALGFAECGRLARQVRLAGEYDDEILMELFL